MTSISELIGIVFLVMFSLVILVALIVAFRNLFKSSENSDLNSDELDSTKIKVTIQCPKCGDTYTIEETEMFGNGLSPVDCYKCGYTYKQKFAIVEDN